MRLLAVLLFTICLPLGNLVAQPGYPGYGYRPPPGWPTQQQAPGTPNFRPQQAPQAQPSYATPMWPGYAPAPQAKPDNVAPKLEATINLSQAYEQQSLIYKLRLTSTGNLQTATPILPASDRFVIRPLGEPVSQNLKEGGKNKVVTDYRYLLMPLTPGALSIPAAKVSGSYNDGAQTTYEVSSQGQVQLNVLPAEGRVQPWLPLNDLRIQTQLADNTSAAMDKPMSLKIVLIADGITGAQLPSIQSLLNDSQFRIYPASSHVEGNVGLDGSLHGRREETFTLVPRSGGWLDIPSPIIAWWDVDQNSAEVAASAPRRVHVQGPEKGQIQLGEESQGIPITFWLPLLVAVVVAILGWLKALIGPGFGMHALPSWLGRVLSSLFGPMLSRVSLKLSPRRYAHKLRRWIGDRLPISWKLWYCLRAVAPEDDPEQWAYALQILTNKHLGTRRHANLKQLGNEILAFHPEADPMQVSLLMQDLDQALYGNQPIHNFRLWKKNLQRQIEPSLFSLLVVRKKRKAAATTLPGLNPRARV